MLSHEEMAGKMLKDPEVKAEYDALEPEFELLDELDIIANRQSGMIQEKAEAETAIPAKAGIRKNGFKPGFPPSRE